ncbi:hypothetical protein DMH12_16865 [Streptomyces sp. WAC 04229]|uniref:hypothetical protein n=1 Tax=Streptomyces sp. WAC 04229 TaxID=2203206 RepID=UPI000F74360C|nr:hypothetical protein [Streptomyces sp. WAC 04229]RSN54130.1 hypothetical protein DMH12_16865 [Streptomyces sp. WAC 04229]
MNQQTTREYVDTPPSPSAWPDVLRGIGMVTAAACTTRGTDLTLSLAEWTDPAVIRLSPGAEATSPDRT